MVSRKTEIHHSLGDLNPEDWPGIARIYAEGIATGNATFETAPPAWQEWDAEHRPDCRISIRHHHELVGWAALSPVSGRCVYGGVAEVSVYVAGEYQGRGLGRCLLDELVRRSEEAGLWTLQAGIFSENTPSLRIHQAAGFRIVGTRERIGKLKGRWRNVVLLERRSPKVGID